MLISKPDRFGTDAREIWRDDRHWFALHPEDLQPLCELLVKAEGMFATPQEKLNALNSLLSLLEAEYMETWANMNPVQAYAMRNGTTIAEAEVELKHSLLPEGEKEVA